MLCGVLESITYPLRGPPFWNAETNVNNVDTTGSRTQSNAAFQTAPTT